MHALRHIRVVLGIVVCIDAAARCTARSRCSGVGVDTWATRSAESAAVTRNGKCTFRASQLLSTWPQVGSHCSDLQELIGGQPWILVRMPAKADTSADESKLSGVDKVRNLNWHVSLEGCFPRSAACCVAIRRQPSTPADGSTNVRNM